MASKRVIEWKNQLYSYTIVKRFQNGKNKPLLCLATKQSQTSENRWVAIKHQKGHKHVKISSVNGNEKLELTIIDTIEIGDVRYSPQGVLIKLAELANFVKEEGFKDYEKCANDQASLRMENTGLAYLNKGNIIYVNNLPLVGCSREINKKVREESCKRLLIYLGTCQNTYQLSNLDILNERIRKYANNQTPKGQKVINIHQTIAYLQEQINKLDLEAKKEEAELINEYNKLKKELTKKKQELKDNVQFLQHEIVSLKISSKDNI
ncbi:hypothetical protein C1646_772627 [Rhizophagus diaphanus]|nr:hypothetical protein C1646_772627 [Rhizophagus diaphanus] [Rhizophagus sp. MUCL 43196]